MHVSEWRFQALGRWSGKPWGGLICLIALRAGLALNLKLFKPRRAVVWQVLGRFDLLYRAARGLSVKPEAFEIPRGR